VEGYSRSGQAVAGAERKAVDLSNTGELVTIINSHDVTIIAVSAGRSVSAEPVIQAHKALIAAKPSGRLLIVGGAVGLIPFLGWVGGILTIIGGSLYFGTLKKFVIEE